VNQKELSSIAAIAALSIIFATACFFLSLHRGKSAYWLRQKMKIGALILSLSASVQQGCLPVTTCYDPVVTDYIHIETTEGEINLNLPQDSIIKGNISQRESELFEFSLEKSDSLLQKGELLPVDGEFDESEEEFTIQVRSDLPEGKYSLGIFGNRGEAGDSNYLLTNYMLNVIQEK
jgi:hypothetical protein